MVIMAAAPASEAPLPLRAKALYASSSLGGEALSQSRALWLLYFYAEEASLLSTLAVGVLVTAGRVIEALDDALVGWWSDRTRSRLGRRIPFVLAATPLWALFAMLLFTPPSDAGPTVAAAYLLLVLELHHLFGTLSGGPYEALLPEIARTSGDRVSIVGIRVYFGAAGAAIGLTVSPILVGWLGFPAMALVIGLLGLGFRYLGLAGVWTRARCSRLPAEIPFRAAVRATFSNASFLAFLPTFVLFQIALQMLLGVLPWYVEAVFRAEEPETWVTVLTAVAIASMLAAVPLFARYARRTSKREAYSAAMLAAACLFPLLFVAGFVPGVPTEPQVLVVMAVIGFPLAGLYLFPATLTADIVDDDSTRTGMRREATYYGTQNFVEKTATSISPLLIALLLLLGESAEDPLGIRLVGPVAGLLVLVGYLVFRLYDLPDEVGVSTPPALPVGPDAHDR
jgi:GPH family glycoside/pentoside/hexuronide:cation symporter